MKEKRHQAFYLNLFSNLEDKLNYEVGFSCTITVDMKNSGRSYKIVDTAAMWTVDGEHSRKIVSCKRVDLTVIHWT